MIHRSEGRFVSPAGSALQAGSPRVRVPRVQRWVMAYSTNHPTAGSTIILLER